MYTVGSWLSPRAGDDKTIEIMQPVSRNRSDVWTDDIEQCIQWYLSGEKKLVFDMQGAKQKKLEERERTKQNRIAQRNTAKEKRLAERQEMRIQRDKTSLQGQ